MKVDCSNNITVSILVSVNAKYSKIFICFKKMKKKRLELKFNWECCTDHFNEVDLCEFHGYPNLLRLFSNASSAKATKTTQSFYQNINFDDIAS